MSITPRPKKYGFTLIELLVVIAIISILMSLIIVGIGLMLTRTKATKDLTNHKTLGAANWTHSVEHNGHLLHPKCRNVVPDKKWHVVFWVQQPAVPIWTACSSIIL